MIKTGNPIISIYTEMTPNPETMKFVANKLLFPGKSHLYCRTGRGRTEKSQRDIALQHHIIAEHPVERKTGRRSLHDQQEQ